MTDDISEEYMIGYAARSGDVSLDLSRTEWQRDWYDACIAMEECDAAERSLQAAIQQMSNIYAWPAEIIWHITKFLVVDLDQDLIDVVRRYQAGARLRLVN